jgi:tetratricopeptide (TPR) repeat protein
MLMNTITIYRRFFAYLLICFLALPGVIKADICLVMVVNNDELVIERTLESVKNLVQYVCICNTGSKDETLPLLHAFKLETGLPVKVVHFEDDHQDASTFALQVGQKILEKAGCDLSKSYLLYLQPGTILSNADSLIDVPLTADAYSCASKDKYLGMMRKTVHLLKASLSWKNQERIYPDWTVKQDMKRDHLDDVEVTSIDDEQYQKEYLRRIIEELKGKEDPKALFYLGLAHKGLHKYMTAIQLLQNYVERGGNRDEVWFSRYMIAECYDAMKEWEMALHWYLETYQFVPERGEPLHKLAVHYRQKGENNLAYLFAKQGMRIPFSSDRELWTVPPLTHYEFEEEMTVAAYYTSYREEGKIAANDLLLKKKVPWYIKEQTYRNLLFYAKRLPEIRSIPIDFERPLVAQGNDELFHPMNPSIFKTDEGYRVICRTVNYTQEGAKTFHTNDPTGVFRTRNFLLDYNRNFHLQSQHEIIENLPRKKIRTFNLEGLDDCRIFDWKDKIWFSCSTGDTNPYGTFQISLCELGDEPEGQNLKVEKLIPLLGPDPYRCEKNWLPFVKEGLLHLIYSYDPFILYTPDIQTGHCETALYYEPAFDFSHFRGSAAPIEFDGGYLMLVHEVVLQSDFSRCYLHRFLFLDKNFYATKISLPFYFLHHGVEYCCNMTLDHAAKELIIPLGVEDREAYLYFFDCDMVRSLLYPLNGNNPHVFSHV